jgi:hypothetical protein
MKMKEANCGGLGRILDARCLVTLPARPAMSVPIPAALVLPPPEVFVRAPFPVVCVNNDSGRFRIVVCFMRVPASIADAGNRCRGPDRRERQNARADERTH